jgi:peptidyl-prolyl cis-trans isomerase C
MPDHDDFTSPTDADADQRCAGQPGAWILIRLFEAIEVLFLIHKTFTPSGPVLIILAILLLHHPLCIAQTHQAGSSILATVNSVPISVDDLTTEISQLKAEMQLRNQFISETRIEDINDQIIENLIDREVLYQQAKLNNIQVRTQWVEEELALLRQRLGGSGRLRAYLNATGMTQNDLQKRLHKGLAIRRLLRGEAIRGIRVTESEMQAFFRRYPEYFEKGAQIRARHILISATPSDEESQRATALQRMRNLERDLNAGTPLAVLALEHSACPSRARGGDLGLLTRDQMMPQFAEVVDAIEPGQVSGIVSTDLGYHLIEVVERTPPYRMTYKNVRPKIERTLRRNKENAAVNAYVARLKKQAKIVHATR